jgi:hypothetical protein
MHGDGSGMRLPIGAAPGKFPGLRARLMLLLGPSLVCAAAPAEPAAKTDAAKPATAQTRDTNPADFVGSEVCATCDEAEAKRFADNPQQVGPGARHPRRVRACCVCSRTRQTLRCRKPDSCSGPAIELLPLATSRDSALGEILNVQPRSVDLTQALQPSVYN